jgi:hypothetical protein
MLHTAPQMRPRSKHEQSYKGHTRKSVSCYNVLHSHSSIDNIDLHIRRKGMRHS